MRLKWYLSSEIRIILHPIGENNRRDIVEALDPLSPFVSLPAHVEHMKIDFIDLELCFENALSQNSTAKEVLVIWKIIWLADILNFVLFMLLDNLSKNKK